MEVNYIIKKTYRRTLTINIKNKNEVIIKAPIFTPDYVINEFIMKKEKWITNKITKLQNQADRAKVLGVFDENDIKTIKKTAKKTIPQRVEYYSKLIGVSYNNISIRLQKSRWGSCTKDGNLSFNCLLVLMPERILDSIVVHELCHRLYMNHSKQFYNEVCKIYPDYDDCHNWLKTNGGIYLERIKK